MKNIIFTFFFTIIYFPSLFGQSNFDVTLRLDFTSAERLIELCEGRLRNVKSVSELKGNQLAAATSALLARKQKAWNEFDRELELIRDNFRSDNDIFGLQTTKNNLAQIKALLAECKKRQLDKKITSTIEAFFPISEKINAVLPVYFVAFGNENAAAFVRRVMWIDNYPVFVGDNQGNAVIVVNLSRLMQYHPKTEIQFIELQSTLAHEAFHAVFSEYQQTSAYWKRVNEKNNFAHQLAALSQNEGIAYYISMQQDIGGEIPAQYWFNETMNAMKSLNDALKELSSDRITIVRARELIMNSNLSGSFAKNYGATAGWRIAYEIDRKLGRVALSETLAKGTKDFFTKYSELCRLNPTLPAIDSSILSTLEE